MTKTNLTSPQTAWTSLRMSSKPAEQLKTRRTKHVILRPKRSQIWPGARCRAAPRHRNGIETHTSKHIAIKWPLGKERAHGACLGQSSCFQRHGLHKRPAKPQALAGMQTMQNPRNKLPGISKIEQRFAWVSEQRPGDVLEIASWNGNAGTRASKTSVPNTSDQGRTQMGIEQGFGAPTNAFGLRLVPPQKGKADVPTRTDLRNAAAVA